MFEGWELHLAYRIGELIKGIGSIICEWATKKRERLGRLSNGAAINRKELPPVKPD